MMVIVIAKKMNGRIIGSEMFRNGEAFAPSILTAKISLEIVDSASGVRTMLKPVYFPENHDCDRRLNHSGIV